MKQFTQEGYERQEAGSLRSAEEIVPRVIGLVKAWLVFTAVARRTLSQKMSRFRRQEIHPVHRCA